MAVNQMVMVKDRVVLAGLSADMWKEEQNEKLKHFLSDPTDKLLVARVANEQLVGSQLRY